jgi:hypothetical protein
VRETTTPPPVPEPALGARCALELRAEGADVSTCDVGSHVGIRKRNSVIDGTRCVTRAP